LTRSLLKDRLIWILTMLKVAINAQIPIRGSGGVVPFLTALIKTLGELDDGDEEYIIVVLPKESEWFKPYLGPNQRVVTRLQTSPQPSREKRPFKRLLNILLKPMVQDMVHQSISDAPRRWPELTISNGFYESLNCDVLHFPFQKFELCAIPTIYNPHDLQHLHFPHFFSASDIAWRETVYPAGCRLSNTTVVASQWVKNDIVSHYGISKDKVQVIPWAPPTQIYSPSSSKVMKAVQEKYQLQLPFTLYPAVTWEHKNHLRLFDALAVLRDREGLVVRLVCTGGRNAHFWPQIKSKIQALNLQEQVSFLDLVPPEDLRAIYRLAEFVVVPTLFEAVSGPVFEAWQEYTPVACSAVTSLPEQVGKAALLFNPYSIDEIAQAVRKMATEPDLRTYLGSEAQHRLRDFSWERTARAYRAVYRRAARRNLTDEDRWLLSWDWMKTSQ